MALFKMRASAADEARMPKTALPHPPVRNGRLLSVLSVRSDQCIDGRSGPRGRGPPNRVNDGGAGSTPTRPGRGGTRPSSGGTPFVPPSHGRAPLASRSSLRASPGFTAQSAPAVGISPLLNTLVRGLGKMPAGKPSAESKADTGATDAVPRYAGSERFHCRSWARLGRWVRSK